MRRLICGNYYLTQDSNNISIILYLPLNRAVGSVSGLCHGFRQWSGALSGALSWVLSWVLSWALCYVLGSVMGSTLSSVMGSVMGSAIGLLRGSCLSQVRL